jgi:hypothetical protein
MNREELFKHHEETRAEYDSWPQAAKDYATANVNQWLQQGCKL